jgi:hypothetical protein
MFHWRACVIETSVGGGGGCFEFFNTRQFPILHISKLQKNH